MDLATTFYFDILSASAMKLLWFYYNIIFFVWVFVAKLFISIGFFLPLRIKLESNTMYGIKNYYHLIIKNLASSQNKFGSDSKEFLSNVDSVFTQKD